MEQRLKKVFFVIIQYKIFEKNNVWRILHKNKTSPVIVTKFIEDL